MTKQHLIKIIIALSENGRLYWDEMHVIDDIAKDYEIPALEEYSDEKGIYYEVTEIIEALN